MNRKRFPRHFQVDSADVSLSIGFYSLIQLGRWREVVLLYEDESVFTTVMDELRRLLNIGNISYEYIRYDTSVNPFEVSIKRMIVFFFRFIVIFQTYRIKIPEFTS